MENDQLDTLSLERIVPKRMDNSCPIESESLQLHIERYEFAIKNAVSGRILDIACGVGYGSRLLADSHKKDSQIIGIDNSKDAISYANQHYAGSNIEFIQADALSYSDRDGFDSIVTLETIEHLEEPQKFIEKLIRLLRPGGVLIASVPITPSTDGNPHHLHDFTAASFRSMMNDPSLKELDSFEQVQPFRLKGTKRVGRLQDKKDSFIKHYAKNPRSLARRLKSLIFDGLNNKYLTIVLKKNLIN